MNSDDDAWALALGEVIVRYRDKSAFEYGQVFDFGEPMSDESRMDHLLIGPTQLSAPEDVTIELSRSRVLLSQVYPIYAEERQIIRAIGFDQFFWRQGIDFSDPRRSPHPGRVLSCAPHAVAGRSPSAHGLSLLRAVLAHRSFE